MLSILTLDNLRYIIVWFLASMMAAVTPTGGFVTSLLLMWFFNVWAGMRADGVINIKCKNWSWNKFVHAVVELVLFLVIVEIVALTTYFMGDAEEGLYASKTIDYVFVWLYFQNGLKNLCKAYPKTKALWIVYLFVRFEFTKIVKIDNLIEMYEEHIKRQEELNNGNNALATQTDNA